MGKYVYLEDEEIEDIKKAVLSYIACEDADDIIDKLLQKTKALKDYKYKEISNIQYETEEKDILNKRVFYYKHYKEIELNNFIYDMGELEVIMNKAKELFKE